MEPILIPEMLSRAEDMAQTPTLAKIVRPTSSLPVVGIATSSSVYEVFTHWVDGQTTPCVAKPWKCAGCVVGLDRRREGYVALWDTRACRQVILEITKHALVNLPPGMRGPEANWRGLWVKAMRAGKHRNAPVVLDFRPAQASDGPLPAPIDVPYNLCHLWGRAWRSVALPVPPQPPNEDNGAPFPLESDAG